jgi:phosphatidylglycerophosphatase A
MITSAEPMEPKVTFAFLLRHPAHLVACGFDSGLSPVAPGTAGTLLAWFTFPWLQSLWPDDLVLGVMLVGLFILGMGVCQITGRHLQTPDHGAIVWDEMVPFWMVLFLAPPGFWWQAAAFAGFRFFDITKPAPAAYFDQRHKNGFGVMMDDLMAAALTVFVLALFKALF